MHLNESYNISQLVTEAQWSLLEAIEDPLKGFKSG